MGRIPRKNKRGQFSKEYLQDIKMKDFLGNLSEGEIEVAKEYGLLRWDLWTKAKGLRISPVEVKKNTGFYQNIAPVLDESGRIDPKKYPQGTKFFIKNYEELEEYLKK